MEILYGGVMDGRALSNFSLTSKIQTMKTKLNPETLNPKP